MSPLRASVEQLRKVPLFASLSDGEIERIIASPHNDAVEFEPMATIIEENQIGDCMFVILSGAVDVRIRAVGGREITIATLKTGEFFGEQALLPGASGRRNATVRALRPSVLFRITKKDVALGISQSDEFGDFTDDLAGATQDDRVRMLLRSVRLFRSLSPKDLDNVDRWTEVIEVEAGKIVIREEEPGDYMYVVLDGTVEVFVVDEDGKVVVLSRLTRGNYFGEQALLPGSTGIRNANVRADSHATLVRVSRKNFQLILSHDDKLRLALRAVGEAQRTKIIQAIGPSLSW